jgi:hypothetical protein
VIGSEEGEGYNCVHFGVKKRPLWVVKDIFSSHGKIVMNQRMMKGVCRGG